MLIGKFVEAQLCLDPSQFGFRSKHSTETALLGVTDAIKLALDKGKL